MTWGLGQLLFGWLAWKSGVLPDWLVVVGAIGGLAGLLTLAVYQSPVFALVQLASFAIWASTAGVSILWGRRAPRSEVWRGRREPQHPAARTSHAPTRRPQGRDADRRLRLVRRDVAAAQRFVERRER